MPAKIQNRLPLEKQNRGHPVRQLSPADWQIIQECAQAHTPVAVCAARLGIGLETLYATEGFHEIWALKKGEAQYKLAKRLADVAQGDAEATMPQATTAIYLSKQSHTLGYADRQDVRIEHDVKFSVVFRSRERELASGETPGQLGPGPAPIEGQIEVLPPDTETTDEGSVPPGDDPSLP